MLALLFLMQGNESVPAGGQCHKTHPGVLTNPVSHPPSLHADPFQEIRFHNSRQCCNKTSTEQVQPRTLPRPGSISHPWLHTPTKTKAQPIHVLSLFITRRLFDQYIHGLSRHNKCSLITRVASAIYSTSLWEMINSTPVTG